MTNYHLDVKTYDSIDTSLIVSKKLKIIGNIKLNFMADQFYWITLDFTGVPNEVVTEC